MSKVNKSLLSKVKDPILMKVTMKDTIVFSSGDLKTVSDSWGISKPLFKESIPMLIKHKFRGCSVRVFDSVKDFKFEMSKVQDSKFNVVIL